MKKLLTLIVLAALCGTASAAAVNWKVAGKSFGTSDGSSERAKDYFVAIILAADLSAVESAIALFDSGDTTTFDALVQSTGKTSSSGATSGSFQTTEAAGTTLQLIAIAFDSDSASGASKYLVSSAVSSDAYVAPANPENAGSFSSDSFANATWTTVPKGGGLPVVPEPATGALALAGIALLFKRRRA